MKEERYVIVALDQDTGEIYFAPETIKTHYSLEDASNLLMSLAEQTRPLRRMFFLLSYSQGISLWCNERLKDDDKTDGYIH